MASNVPLKLKYKLDFEKQVIINNIEKKGFSRTHNDGKELFNNIHDDNQ